MTKILLVLAILGSGGGAFLVARQSSTLLRREANATHESWLLQTRLVTVAQNDQAALIKRVRQLKELAQMPTSTESPLWLALRTNQVGHLPPDLRERLFEELGFNWKSSDDFIVVSKETIHDISMMAIQDGKLTEVASTVLALTPAERSQVEAAMQRVQTDFNDWARSHTERIEPKDNVVADYTFHNDPTERSEPHDDIVARYTFHNDPTLSVSNRFAAGLHEAVGRERAELILYSARNYFVDIGIGRGDRILKVSRYLVGNETRYKFKTSDWDGTEWLGSSESPSDVSKGGWFPPAFRPFFPNGWSDVAQQEGFELPEEPQEK